MKKFLYKFLVAPSLYLLLYLLSATLRIEILDNNRAREKEDIFYREREGKRIIYIFWHGRMFIFPYLYRKEALRYAILVSPSLDGEIVADVLSFFGFSLVRGSSYKKGVKAYYQLRERLKGGSSLAIIADGSRGPVYKLQPGILHLARYSGVQIVPMTFGAKRRIIFRTWDNFLLPFPFTRVIIIYGEPVFLPGDISLGELKNKQLELEKSLNEIRAKADSYFEERRID